MRAGAALGMLDSRAGSAAFEAEWAAWLEVPYAVGCASGLDAIEIGLRALGIGEGDEVITTPMTAFATVLAIRRAGAAPVLADIERDTAMLSMASVQRCISRRTKAILLVHLYGRVGPIEELQQVADAHGVALVEDCAQAHGARINGRSLGSIGAFGAWSFCPTKNLGAIGNAGAITTSNAELAQKARWLRNYGQSIRYVHPMVGLNSRLDELQAALLRARLRHLEIWTARRRAIANLYRAGVRNAALRILPPAASSEGHVYHLFVVTSSYRDELEQHLKMNGVQALIHYPIPIHLQESCRQIRCDPIGLPVAELHAKECLSLPCHPWLSDEQVQHVIDSVNRFRCGRSEPLQRTALRG